ncbi:transposase [Chryseobacterium nematophagum]|uniref:Transposase n=1 Tax=Chryseobacterium nematophagum TaxID=2305228 RepID=A0A3M7LED6_9FLAO|nr:transposase [Chryseobacterium nematophagum]RMZ59866.1 transposase [Chryseobacterium nematophagum]
MEDSIFKEIHIGGLIKKRVEEMKTDVKRICVFMKLSEGQIDEVYNSNSIEAGSLLRWSKLLEYDFFRVYSQHLILYAPPAATNVSPDKATPSLPVFRKNLYTKEVIDFITDLIRTNKKSKQDVMKEYNIPKTTLYKWLRKY